MPKINRDSTERVHRQAYPGRLRQRTTGCWKWRLSDAGGLTQFGAGEVELAPGASTGLYHWHVNEDELVYILAGEVVMVEGDAEQLLRAGDCATFKAGVRVGHSFENRSDAPARLLEVGHRHPEKETAHYPGYDLVYRREGQNVRFETRDGQGLAPDDEVARIEEEGLRKPPSPLDIA